MQLDRHYTDPLLTSVYDIENSGRHDIDFYLGLAARLRAEVVVDIGCGTGVLAADLARAGATALGVDPAAAMLAVARSRPGGEQVRWIEGDSSVLEDSVADLVVMTGHVAQVFVDDGAWRAVLADAHRALRSGGMLAFETRNPAAAAWTGWTREQTFDTYPMHDGESFQSWVQVTEVAGDVVTFEGHTVFGTAGRADALAAGPGGAARVNGADGPVDAAGLVDAVAVPDHRVATSTLRFRSRQDVSTSLQTAGFRITEVFGDWAGGPATAESPELIFIAQV